MKTEQYIEDLCIALKSLDPDHINACASHLFEVWERQGTVFLAGNGGSAATASHMACDFDKSVASGLSGTSLRGLRSISLLDVSRLSAWANDQSYDDVFAEQIRTLARPGDMLIVVSGSGNSRNVLNALRAAREALVDTVALLGFGGGEAAGLADRTLLVDSDVYGIVEDVHLALNHMVTVALREHIERRAEHRPQESGPSWESSKAVVS